MRRLLPEPRPRQRPSCGGFGDDGVQVAVDRICPGPGLIDHCPWHPPQVEACGMKGPMSRQLDPAWLPVDVEHGGKPDVEGGVLGSSLRIHAELQVDWVPRLLRVLRESAECAAVVEELQEVVIDTAVVAVIQVARNHITTMSHVEAADS
jgi:hypothetical protein